MLNKLREKMEKGEQTIGTFVSASNEAFVECLGYTGLDYVIIDTEHGPYDTMDMMSMIRAAESVDLTPLVRIADVTHKEIQRAADCGAQGLIVPCIRTMEEIHKLVDLAKYSPLGNRGFIKGRGCHFGNQAWAAGSMEQFMEMSNEKLLVLPQCETAECLDIIEDVMKVDGVDGIFIGPFDLSFSMGIPGRFDEPVFEEAIQRILKACQDAGKPAFIFTPNEEAARARLAQGFDSVTNGLDPGVITAAYKEMVRKIRG